jgi:hypothetical protein
LFYLRYAIAPPPPPKKKVKEPKKKLKKGSDSEGDDNSEEEAEKEEGKEEEKEDPLDSLKWTVKKLEGQQPWTVTIGFLEPATKYLFQLAAENDKGTSSFSEPTTSATTATPPEPPANTLAVATAPNKMHVFWPAPYDNGAPVRSYIIKRRAGGAKGTFGDEMVRIAAMCKLPPPEMDHFGRPYGYEMLPDAKWLGTEVDGLRANTVYEFSMQGVNKYGVGLASYPSPETPTHPPVISDKMSSPVLFDETPDVCTIKWTPPAWDGGAEITTYRLRRETNKDSNWGNERVVKPGDGESEVDLPTQIFLDASRDKIQKGKKYRYQVAAVSIAGTSPWSEASNEIKVPTKLEFIVINAERKKAKKMADATAKKKKKEEEEKKEQKK